MYNFIASHLFYVLIVFFPNHILTIYIVHRNTANNILCCYVLYSYYSYYYWLSPNMRSTSVLCAT